MYKYIYKIEKEDINVGNHVGNERALMFFQRVREKFLEENNLEEINVGNDIGIIQTNAYIEYLSQIFLGDEIKIIISNVEINRLQFIFNYEIKVKEKIAIKGYTTMLPYSYKEQKVKKLPESFKKLLENVFN